MARQATPDEQAAMNYFNRMREAKDGQLALPVREFLRKWANEPVPFHVLDKALATLDAQAEYTPEKLIHKIVLDTVQAWADRNATR